MQSECIQSDYKYAGQALTTSVKPGVLEEFADSEVYRVYGLEFIEARIELKGLLLAQPECSCKQCQRSRKQSIERLIGKWPELQSLTQDVNACQCYQSA